MIVLKYLEKLTLSRIRFWAHGVVDDAFQRSIGGQQADEPCASGKSRVFFLSIAAMMELILSCTGWIDRHIVGRASMANAQHEWLAFGRRIGRRALLCAVFATLLAAASAAQDAGVSGIPLGPANINGQNNTGRDPSGIGNAAKIAPPPPEPSVHAVTPPTAAPLVSTRVGRVGVVRPRFSHLSPRERRIAERAAVKEYDRLLKHGAVSICRGC